MFEELKTALDKALEEGKIKNTEFMLYRVDDSWYAMADNPSISVRLGESDGRFITGDFDIPEEAMKNLIAQLESATSIHDKKLIQSSLVKAIALDPILTKALDSISNVSNTD